MRISSSTKIMILSILLIFPSFLHATTAVIEKVYEENGDIFVQYTRSTPKQLTLTGTNAEPCLAKNKAFIVFVRIPKSSQIDKGMRETQLILFDLAKSKERLIVQGCRHEGEKADIDYANSKQYPFPDLCWISKPRPSNDDKRIYFATSAWATSGAIHYYSFDTGKISFFSDGDLKGITPDGNVIVSRTGPASEEKGRYVQDWLFTANGKAIKPVGKKDY